jgi:hypothetical protein
VRVLVAAARADRGLTSEGLCSARVARLLADRGHQVRLLVGQAGAPGPAEVHAEAEAAVGTGIEVVVVPTRDSRAARAGWWAAGRSTRFRPDLAVQVATGGGLDERAALRAWAAALREHERSWAPDVTYVRGAGLDLTPVRARARWGGAWLGHLHDPWPGSWYPPRYAERSRLVSGRQEAAAHRLLQGVPVLTLPSAGLVRWMAERAGVDPGGRAHVVPHLGLPLPAGAPDAGPGVPWPARPFVVAHLGALLGPRDPTTLLEGWRRLAEQQPQAADEVGLAFCGSIDRRHLAHGGWARWLDGLDAREAIAVGTTRVRADVARHAAAVADVGAVIESPDPVSPFLPAKVADLVASGKPVLALTRAGSPTAELLGADHPLRADPDDADAVARALATAWRAWQDGTLHRLAPPAGAAERVSAPVVGAALDAALEAAVSGRGRG